METNKDDQFIGFNIQMEKKVKEIWTGEFALYDRMFLYLFVQ